MANICNGTDLDFFLVESGAGLSREAMLGMGMDAYVLFKNDGTVEMLMMGMSLTGTWCDGVMTFADPEDENETNEMKFILDGDILTIPQETDGDIIFKRSDYDAYQ